MLFIKFNSRGEPVRASTVRPPEGEYRVKGMWESRWDWKSFERVHYIVEMLNTLGDLRKFLPVDKGPDCSPRYDIIVAPAVGDKISYSFNGDSYPDGEIVKISKDYRVVTSSTGSRYWRSGFDKGAAWVKSGGTWSMIKGHVSEWNREF